MTRIPKMDMGGAPNEDEPKTMSLLGGVAGGGGGGFGGMSDADLAAMDNAGKSGLLNQNVLIVVAVVLVAAGTLYAMRLTQGDLKPQIDKAVEGRIEDALVKLANRDKLDPNNPIRSENIDELFRDTESILGMFSADVAATQVPIEYVKKNPFELTGKADGGVVVPVNDGEKARARRRAQLESELSNYKLNSVMLGTRKIAIIGSDFKQEGDTLGSFKVEKIEELSVTLSAEGETFQLTIETRAENGSKRRRN